MIDRLKDYAILAGIGALALVIVVGVGVWLADDNIASTMPSPPHPVAQTSGALVSASGKMNPGTVLYQSSGDLFGTIITPGPEEVSIRLPDGRVEIKSRQTVRDYFYVRE